jgi:hypothetical protein
MKESTFLRLYHIRKNNNTYFEIIYLFFVTEKAKIEYLKYKLNKRYITRSEFKSLLNDLNNYLMFVIVSPSYSSIIET